MVGVGQNENDYSFYSHSGIGETKCNGYALSLTELTESSSWALSKGAKEMVGTSSLSSQTHAEKDWSGYYNHKKIEQFISNPTNETDWTDFPAANACETYGDVFWFSAPDNTTGWFLPSYGMLQGLRNMTKIETAASTYATMEDLLKDRFDVIKKYIENKKDPIYNEIPDTYKYKDDIIGFIGVNGKTDYWSSTEIRSSTYRNTYAFVSGAVSAIKTKTTKYKQRAYLAF